ncbi:DNA polymerase III subunit delta [Flavobacterium sp.]|uniref:DNA polymerase III subunit delta n=1 Tax=Flavobacterium sp. TaxID=239 RepID=UPI001B6E046D|nr:DNA polymerase III subunit delta [Flavobacterium sp.]MBP6126993.1 DNA polymerase III subunit delta [Flavobacterium sp.]
MTEVIKIVNDIKSKNYKPIYFLCGEETYYIDRISDLIEKSVLTEDEKSFNQVVLYGRDTTVEEIVSTAKRFPMMSDYQVVIVKEAQNLSKTFDKFESYALNPQLTTILVFAYRDKPDGRKKIFKTIKDKGVWFESKKLYDNQVPDWIVKVLKGQNYGIEPKAAAMLAEFLGTDLAKINNELEKLKIVFPEGHIFTPKNIEENIGFSKDYNVFELKSALATRNQQKAYTIIHNFAANPKDNPIVVVSGQMFTFFAQLLQYHGLKDKSKFNAAKALGVNPFFMDEYATASKNYPMRKVSQIIEIIRDMDVKSKGVGSGSMKEADMLKELVYKIFN